MYGYFLIQFLKNEGTENEIILPYNLFQVGLLSGTRPELAKTESRPSLKVIKCERAWVKIGTEYHQILFEAKPLLQLQ